MRRETIKEEIVELHQPLLEATRKTKPTDHKNKLNYLNNTINNLQLSVEALSFNQLPAIQSKEYKRKESFDYSNREHQNITRTVSDIAITSQIDGAESEEVQFSGHVPNSRKKTRMHYDFDSKLETRKELFTKYKHTKPSILIKDYAKRIKSGQLTGESVKEELGMIILSTITNAKNVGGEIRRVSKGSDKHNKLERKIQYLGVYRDTLKTIQSAIDKN